MLTLALKGVPTIRKIEKELCRVVKFGTIHKREDERLNGIGLRSKMPDEYYDKKHKLYKDLYARYKKAKIEFIEVDF